MMSQKYALSALALCFVSVSSLFADASMTSAIGWGGDSGFASLSEGGFKSLSGDGFESFVEVPPPLPAKGAFDSLTMDGEFALVPTAAETKKKRQDVINRTQAAYKAPNSDAFHGLVSSDAGKVHWFGTDYEAQSGYVLEKPDGSTVLVFKGTNSLENWKTNLHANWAINRASGGRVHNGMLLHWRAVKNPVLNILEGIAKRQGKELYQLPLSLEGHSLGAATATIAADELKDLLGIQTINLVGSPKVLDHQTKENFDDKFAGRVENMQQALDPVPAAQPISPLRGVLGYVGGPVVSGALTTLQTAQHVGNVVTLPASNRVPHKLDGYRADLNEAQPAFHAKSFLGRCWTKMSSVVSKAEHYAHKAFKRVKDRALERFFFSAR
ncbi:MAG: lipase family protein [Holosporaceae bacterium]